VATAALCTTTAQTVPSNRPSPCSTNCERDLDVPYITQVVPAELDAVIDVNTNRARLASITMTLPSGTMHSAQTGQVNVSSEATSVIHITPVPRSDLYGSYVSVDRSRQDIFPATLSYAAAVVSAPFQCATGSASGFRFNATLEAFIDPSGTFYLSTVFSIPSYRSSSPDVLLPCTTMLGDTANAARNPIDVCLATLVPSTKQWVCIYSDYASRVANPSWVADEGRGKTLVRGKITSCYVTAGGARSVCSYFIALRSPVMSAPRHNSVYLT